MRLPPGQLPYVKLGNTGWYPLDCWNHPGTFSFSHTDLCQLGSIPDPNIPESLSDINLEFRQRISLIYMEFGFLPLFWMK